MRYDGASTSKRAPGRWPAPRTRWIKIGVGVLVTVTILMVGSLLMAVAWFGIPTGGWTPVGGP